MRPLFNHFIVYQYTTHEGDIGVDNCFEELDLPINNVYDILNIESKITNEHNYKKVTIINFKLI